MPQDYRLIVFGSDWDVYLHAFRDFIDNERIDYIATFRPSGIAGLIQRIHFNPALNHILPLPGKSCWNPTYLQHSGIQQDEKVCFLVLETWLRMEQGIHLLPYLKQQYPQAKIVIFTQDLIHTIIDHYTRTPIDVAYIKQYADLWISYDRKDAARHAVAYYPTVFSPIRLPLDDTTPECDIFFLGADKGRLPMLIQICQQAIEHGLKPKFILTGVPADRRVEQEGIEYLQHEISYSRNLQYVRQARCVLEILQPQASSPTFRTWEAISLGRKLLTNHLAIRDSEFYHADRILTFESVEDIPWDSIRNDIPHSTRGSEDIRPERLLHYIDQQLTIHIVR